MTSKITVAGAAAALALGMSAMFGGVAFAGGEHETNNVGGAGGSGGNSSTRCAVPVGISGALILAQSNDVQQCNANGGNGGGGGEAKNF
jgi:hypothetical protein